MIVYRYYPQTGNLKHLQHRQYFKELFQFIAFEVRAESLDSWRAPQPVFADYYFCVSKIMI